MKQCPTCQRTYADDSLRFCLQDGATLLSVGDASDPFDADATLRNVSPGGSDLPPTEILGPRAAPTMRSPQPAAATMPQLRADTRDARDSAPPSASSNRGLMAGIIAIALLLLALVGIGVALLMRGQTAENANTQTTTERGNRTANEKAAGDANSNESDNASPAKAKANDSAPAANMPEQGAAARVEAKILKDVPLTERDLAGLSPLELRQLRNTVYARHGRTFDTPELQRYFDSRPWYRPRSDYSSEDLTPTDRNNIKLIQTTENGGM